jgi:hypothetical protein
LSYLFFKKISFLNIHRLFQLVSDRIASNLLFEYLTICIIITDNAILIMNADNEETKDIFPLALAIYYFAELILRLLSKHERFFNNMWSYVDSGIVMINLLARIMVKIQPNPFSTLCYPLIILRLTKIKPFRLIISKIFSSMKDLLESFLILFYFWTLFALMGKELFSGLLSYRCINASTGKPWMDDGSESFCGNFICPEGHICVDLLRNPDKGLTTFDNFFSSLIQVFRISTLDDWSKLMNITQKAYSNYVWIYYVVLILVCNILLNNLLLGVLKVIYSETLLIGSIFDKDFAFSNKDDKHYNLFLLKENGLYPSKLMFSSAYPLSENTSPSVRSKANSLKIFAKGGRGSMPIMNKSRSMLSARGAQVLLLNMLKTDPKLCKKMLPQHYKLIILHEKAYQSESRDDVISKRSEKNIIDFELCFYFKINE